MSPRDSFVPIFELGLRPYQAASFEPKYDSMNHSFRMLAQHSINGRFALQAKSGSCCLVTWMHT